MNTTDIDKRIEQVAQQVHSPQGEYADRENVYARLRKKMKLGPTLAPQGIEPQRESLTLLGFFRRYGVAASLLLFISLAVAGIFTYQQRWSVPESQPVAESPNDSGKKEDLVFKAATMEAIAAHLSKTYRQKILVINADLKGYKVTATFSADESLTEVLSALCTVAKCQWKKTDEGYVIY